MVPNNTSDLINQYLGVMLAGAGGVLGVLWLAVALWAARDQHSRHRAWWRAALVFLLVALLPVFGLVVYLLLRPRERLVDVYTRTLEQEALLQQIEERPTCPGCSRKVDTRWLACPYCHTRLRQPCSNCFAPLELQWDLCPFCATAVGTAEQPGAPVITAELSEAGVANPEQATSQP